MAAHVADVLDRAAEVLAELGAVDLDGVDDDSLSAALLAMQRLRGGLEAAEPGCCRAGMPGAAGVQSFGGMWFGRATLDPVSGTVVDTTLRMIERELFDADWAEAKARLDREPTIPDLARTPAQRRFFTGALRRAIEIRDRTCFHPSCDEVPERPEIDHIHEAAKGGTTTQRNGRYGCHFHNIWTYRHPDDDPDADPAPPLG